MTPETATASASRKGGRRKARATGAGKPSLYDQARARFERFMGDGDAYTRR